MKAYINFGSAHGPFQTCSSNEIEYRNNDTFVKFHGRWRKVRMMRGRQYITVDGQPVRVLFE